MQLKKFLLFFLVSFLVIASAESKTGVWNDHAHSSTKTRLIATFYQDEQGNKKLIAGINFKIAPGWKIYGNGSDGVGSPPTLDFSESKNYRNHQILWPEAKLEEEEIAGATLKYYTYQGEITIPIEIDVQNIADETKIDIKLNYGLCKDVCIPVSDQLVLDMSGEVDKIDEAVFSQIRQFAPQLSYKASYPDLSSSKVSGSQMSDIFTAILIAIFGGLILNIMPCVLPVLSIKLMSVIRAGDSRRKKNLPTKILRVRWAFLATTIGILSCFVFFAIFAGLVKITGNSLGWGLQFQNPYFLIFLLLILTIFTGNLLGLFEVNTSEFLATFLHKKITKFEGGRDDEESIFLPNFLSGVLAVLLATPCSAPFLGAAISFALVQNFLVIFVIFLCMGIGFAAPYIVLIVTPRLVNLFPKPGDWMIKAKQLMAGLLVATILWLIYVLANNIGSAPSFLVTTILVLILLCFRVKSQFIKSFSLIALVIISFSLPAGWHEYKQAGEKHDDRWLVFNEAEIHRQVNRGKVVIVDITADWCLTCKFNEVRVFRDKEVMNIIYGGDVIRMRGDITKPNEEVMKFLQHHNRFAIPFNAVYGPSARDGLLTSELLTKRELLDLVRKAEAQTEW